MNIPKIDYPGNKINPTWIAVTWDGISDWSQTGGDDVIYYQLEWLNSELENWVALT